MCKNLLLGFDRQKSFLVAFDLDSEKIVDAYRQNESGAPVYVLADEVSATILVVRRAEDGRAIFDLGGLYTIRGLYQCLVGENKLAAAVELCAASEELQSLELLQPLLIQLTRRKRAVPPEIYSSESYRALLRVVNQVGTREEIT
ncbi:MAG: hypothetical protein P4M11_15515 [Candidatus Pacebacteria bacterium]|nr:hypothetical protein [Candidatus Paceibacterota bacterium]